MNGYKDEDHVPKTYETTLDQDSIYSTSIYEGKEQVRPGQVWVDMDGDYHVLIVSKEMEHAVNEGERAIRKYLKEQKK